MGKKPVIVCVLCAAMLIASPMHAATGPDPSAKKAPVPAKAPIRVPFSAFRTKPILDMHSNEESLKDAKGKKPIKLHIQPMRILPQQKPAIIAKEAAKAAPSKAEPETETSADDQATEEVSQRTAVFVGNIPLPPRKPGTSSADDIIAMPATARNTRGAFVDNTAAEPAPEAVPAPQEQAEDVANADATATAPDDEAAADADNAPYVPQKKTNALANALRARFEDDVRTAGTSFRPKGDALHIASLGSGDLHAMLQPDANGDISPVLLPGRTETVAAPDAQKEDPRSGLPAQVIVFFQEASPKMEVGQLDVVNADVVGQLQDNPGLNLEIVGFSEKLAAGDAASQKMAATRAAELRDYLKTQHIDGDRLTVTAKGDDTDVEPRDRVEMYFTQ